VVVLQKLRRPHDGEFLRRERLAQQFFDARGRRIRRGVQGWVRLDDALTHFRGESTHVREDIDKRLGCHIVGVLNYLNFGERPMAETTGEE
jgi:hypothetical protein